VNLLAFLSDRCNMTCSYCFLALNQGKPVVLALGDLERAIDAHRQEHPKGRITLLGGEPSLHWELLRGAAARAGAPLTVVTNGTRLDGARLRELQELGARICVSLDGGSPDNDGSRKLLAGGSALVAALLKLEGADKAALRVNMVLKPETAGRLLQNLEFLRAEGFRSFSFHPDVMGDWDEAAVAALKTALASLRRYLAAVGPSVQVSHAAAYAAACESYEDVVLGADGRYYPCDGLFAKPYGALAAYRCGDARSGLDEKARARWHDKARRDIHGWIGAHHTCPREPYFRALAEGAPARDACARYAAADAVLAEALCATA
jgi:MoaA/NifB/PqqE/SkfB family radical SAM enzyme